MILLPLSLVVLVLFFFWWREKRRENPKKKSPLLAALFLVVSLLFACFTVYVGLPYHGKLAWKIQELWNHETFSIGEVRATTEGMDGLLAQLEGRLGSLDSLYIAEPWIMDFDSEGRLIRWEVFLYGQGLGNKVPTYLLSYSKKKADRVEIWTGQAEFLPKKEKSTSGLRRLLQAPSWRKELQDLLRMGKERIRLIYQGEETFDSLYQVKGIGPSGDLLSEISLFRGEQLVGYSMTLEVPEEEGRKSHYVLLPRRKSEEEVREEAQEEVRDKTGRSASPWVVDRQDGTVTTFLSGNKQGFRLRVMDAATGSYFYQLEATLDGGKTWVLRSENPFLGNIGQAEGLFFEDDRLGFIGLEHGGGSSSEIFRSEDGGKTWTPLSFPPLKEENLPESGKKMGLKPEDYAYYQMPQKEEGRYLLKISPGAGEEEDILLESLDRGKTWSLGK